MNRYGPEFGLELYHHGVKGQKWGVRRTAEQLGHKTRATAKAKANSFKGGINNLKKNASNAVSKLKAKRDQRKAEKETERTGSLVFSKDMTNAQKKEAVLKTRSAAELYKHADLFDNNELNAAYNRLNTERNIKNLIPAEKSKGKAYIEAAQKVGDAFQKTSNMISSASNMYNNVAKVFNAISGADDQLPIIGEKKEKSKPETKEVTSTTKWTDPKTGMVKTVVEKSKEIVTDKDKNRPEKLSQEAANVGKKVTASISTQDYNEVTRKNYETNQAIQNYVQNMYTARVVNDINEESKKLK